ncbi:hypothetical protein CK203_031160 [Vitis vinifera]|uniref:Uncharacterized protein n=1 Tax=Vitis vinifera TaxID=29760 RepID=A0A438J0I0_VITVI|nr:hypothetical protein CK203_031160 [Vitis vinifera]
MLDPPPVDGSTMIVKKPRGGAKPNGTNHNVNMAQGRQESMKNLTKKKLRCSYSKKACHTKEKCGKLHGETTRSQSERWYEELILLTS